MRHWSYLGVATIVLCPMKRRVKIIGQKMSGLKIMAYTLNKGILDKTSFHMSVGTQPDNYRIQFQLEE